VRVARALVALLLASCLIVGAVLACSSSTGQGGKDASSEHRPNDGGGGGDGDGSGEAGGPVLVSLRVSGPGSLALVPPFASDIYDYYVPCQATNELTVAMTASPGALSHLKAPKSSPSKTSQTLSLKVSQNQAIVAVATSGDASTEYWVRCLPPDFPVISWSPHGEAGAPTPGYYLVGNVLEDLPAGLASYAMVLDGHGVPVWYVRSQNGFGMSTVDSLEPGFISYFPYSFPGFGSFSFRNVATHVITGLPADGGVLDSHELYRLADGHYLAFMSPLTTGVDLTGVPVALPDGGTALLGKNSVINDCQIVEMDAGGKVVWSWLASDHFDPRVDTAYATVANEADGGAEVDVFHCNSIDVDPTTKYLLISARNMSSVFLVDRTTKSVVWKMGGSPSSKDDATYVTVADPFALQHDARFLPTWSSCSGGSGQISVFDDESIGPMPARGIVYDVIVGLGDAGADAGSTCDGGASLEGGSAGKAIRAWQYKGEFNSGAMGSFRILADGSRIIGWGVSAGTTFTEVDVEGKDLVDFAFGGNNPSYRAIKVPLSAFDLPALRSTAGLP
jgi:Arylsulfotransferase (ASST)